VSAEDFYFFQGNAVNNDHARKFEGNLRRATNFLLRKVTPIFIEFLTKTVKRVTITGDLF
jgi:hypothetical protein